MKKKKIRKRRITARCSRYASSVAGLNFENDRLIGRKREYK